MLCLKDRTRLESNLETRVSHSEAHRVHVNVVVHLSVDALSGLNVSIPKRSRRRGIDEDRNIDRHLFTPSLPDIPRQGGKTRMPVDGALGKVLRKSQRIVRLRIRYDELGHWARKLFPETTWTTLTCEARTSQPWKGRIRNEQLVW